MDLFKDIAKWSLILGPIGAFIYVNRKYAFGKIHKKHRFEDSDLSENFRQYIKENDLITPCHYKNYQKGNKAEQFFEKGILKDLNGLDQYNIYLDRKYHDVITDAIEVTPEERLEYHKAAKLHCPFIANATLQGHAGIVHGGFLSTIMDNLLGCLSFIVSDFSAAVTAYLNMTFKKPVEVGKEYIAIVEVEKIEGRKIFFKGRIMDLQKTVYCTAESLFIKVNLESCFTDKTTKTLLKEKKAHDQEHAAKKTKPQEEQNQAKTETLEAAPANETQNAA